MTNKEFTKKMKELGYTVEYIKEILQEQQESKRMGITPPALESYLIELPTGYPSSKA